MKLRNKKLSLILLGALFGLNILAWTAVLALGLNNFLEINFFDVGQGDSIFIETPSQNQILIDGGPGSSVLEKLGREIPFWDRTIDLVVLTHPEADHMSGLIEVLKRYKVENVLWTGVKKDTSEYEKWSKTLEKEVANVIIARAGEKITAGKAEIEVLWPLESMENKELSESNDSSVILRMVYGQKSFLFTGDAAKISEESLVSGGALIDSDVLKIGHHGSKTSSSDEFLEKISPEIGVIEVGRENKYGHPNQDVLDRLLKYAIKILRTDIDGDIKMISDGKIIKY
jgi:competence protein ComEC